MFRDYSLLRSKFGTIFILIKISNKTICKAIMLLLEKMAGKNKRPSPMGDVEV